LSTTALYNDSRKLTKKLTTATFDNRRPPTVDGAGVRMLHNLHARVLPVAEAEVGTLLQGLSGTRDHLWPRDAWPPMAFDRPLEVGASGGHGPVRYRVEAVTTGRCVRFRCTRPRGFDGFHEFSTVPLRHADTASGSGTGVPAGDRPMTELRHLLVIRPRGAARLTVRLFWMPLHDALLEDCLDRAERQL